MAGIVIQEIWRTQRRSVGDDLLANAFLLRDLFELLLKDMEELKARLTHQFKYVVFSMLWGDFQAAGDVMSDELLNILFISFRMA